MKRNVRGNQLVEADNSKQNVAMHLWRVGRSRCLIRGFQRKGGSAVETSWLKLLNKFKVLHDEEVL